MAGRLAGDTGNKERGCGAGSGVRVERQKQSRAGAGRREEGGLRNVRMRVQYRRRGQNRITATMTSLDTTNVWNKVY